MNALSHHFAWLEGKLAPHEQVAWSGTQGPRWWRRLAFGFAANVLLALTMLSSAYRQFQNADAELINTAMGIVIVLAVGGFSFVGFRHVWGYLRVMYGAQFVITDRRILFASRHGKAPVRESPAAKVESHYLDEYTSGLATLRISTNPDVPADEWLISSAFYSDSGEYPGRFDMINLADYADAKRALLAMLDRNVISS